ncbi:MAG: carboxymuconolactone decarboxylase family protein [Desulfosporosinus sp.]|nr:carboxymuconolactone decarboxylase family protein [Desulfosporosinus sp.]
MSLDQRTLIATQISAAVACNALAALRLAVTEAANVGLSPEEIKEIIALARDIQQQPISHVAHLTDQLLREPKKEPHKHGANCGCGSHHA